MIKMTQKGDSVKNWNLFNSKNFLFLLANSRDIWQARSPRNIYMNTFVFLRRRSRECSSGDPGPSLEGDTIQLEDRTNITEDRRWNYDRLKRTTPSPTAMSSFRPDMKRGSSGTDTCTDRIDINTAHIQIFIFFLMNTEYTTLTTLEFTKEVFKTELFQYNYYSPHTKSNPRVLLWL